MDQANGRLNRIQDCASDFCVCVEDFRRRNLEVGLMHVRGGVRDRLRKTPAMDTIGANHIFMSIEAGVQAYLRRSSAPASSDNVGTESHE